jgi:DUF917 family protein
MNTNDRKEQWINEVLDSTGGMQKANAAPRLYERVIANINPATKSHNITISLKQWAAAATILLALNLGSVIYFARQKSNAPVNAVSQLAGEMQTETIYNY